MKKLSSNTKENAPNWKRRWSHLKKRCNYFRNEHANKTQQLRISLQHTKSRLRVNLCVWMGLWFRFQLIVCDFVFNLYHLSVFCWHFVCMGSAACGDIHLIQFEDQLYTYTFYTKRVFLCSMHKKCSWANDGCRFRTDVRCSGGLQVASWNASDVVKHIKLPAPHRCIRLHMGAHPRAEKGALTPFARWRERKDVSSQHIGAIESINCAVATVPCHCAWPCCNASRDILSWAPQMLRQWMQHSGCRRVWFDEAVPQWLQPQLPYRLHRQILRQALLQRRLVQPTNDSSADDSVVTLLCAHA